MEIFPLSEGTFTVDKSKYFIPFNNNDSLKNKPSGSLLVEIQPFAVITFRDVLLLDTGLGLSDETGRLQLHVNLEKAGIAPSSVTKILLSHLHKDHTGGISLKRGSVLEEQLSFPSATYYVQSRELEFALKKGNPSFSIDDFEVLKKSSRLVLLENHSGTINDDIHYEVTSAHSPFHQVFWIKNDNEIIFYGGDDAPQLQQMKHRFIARYDYDGRKSSQLRREWWTKGEKEKWTFLFYHDVKNPTWKF